MVRFFKNIVGFNDNVSTMVSRKEFVILAILVLSLVSLYTTFRGFEQYSDNMIVAFAASLAVQLVMLYAAIQYGRQADKADGQAFLFLGMFLSAMAVSSFFSFTAFHAAVEPPQRRAEEADSLLRSEWASVYNKVRIQVQGEFARRLTEGGEPQNRPYDRWATDVSDLRAAVASFEKAVREQASSRISGIEGSFDVNERDRRTRELTRLNTQRSQLELERDDLAARAFQQDEEAKRLGRLAVEEGAGRIPQADGRPGVPICGTKCRDLQRQAASQTRQLELTNVDLNTKRREIEFLQQRIDNLRAVAGGNGNEADPAAGLPALRALKGDLDSLQEEVQSLGEPRPTPQNIAIDDLPRFAGEISGISTGCRELKARYASVRSAMQAAGLAPPEARHGAVQASRCDTEPTFFDGQTVSSHIRRFSTFLTECKPGALPESPTRAGGTMTEEQAKEAYEAIYRILSTRLRQCIADAPSIQSGAADANILEDFRGLLQKYNPEAHPFTRAVAAFQRGDWPGYLAAVIAVVIDGLVLIAGLGMAPARDPRERLIPENETLDTEHDREEFARQNSDFCRDLLWAVSKIRNPQIMSINGSLQKSWLVDSSMVFIKQNKHLVEQAERLNILSESDDSIVITERQKDLIEDLFYRFQGVKVNA